MTTVDGGVLDRQGRVAAAARQAPALVRPDQGRAAHRGRHHDAGFKYNMNNVTATIGLQQLQGIGAVIEAHSPTAASTTRRSPASPASRPRAWCRAPHRATGSTRCSPTTPTTSSAAWPPSASRPPSCIGRTTSTACSRRSAGRCRSSTNSIAAWCTSPRSSVAETGRASSMRCARMTTRSPSSTAARTPPCWRRWRRCWPAGNWRAGRNVAALEAAIARHVQRPDVACLGDMTHALALALQLAGVVPGDDVLTLFVQLHVVQFGHRARRRHAGVGSDIDAATATLSAADCERAITPRHRAPSSTTWPAIRRRWPPARVLRPPRHRAGRGRQQRALARRSTAARSARWATSRCSRSTRTARSTAWTARRWCAATRPPRRGAPTSSLRHRPGNLPRRPRRDRSGFRHPAHGHVVAAEPRPGHDGAAHLGTLDARLARNRRTSRRCGRRLPTCPPSGPSPGRRRAARVLGLAGALRRPRRDDRG